MANIIRLGSLYLCGNPVSVEDDYLSRPNWSIEIGETVPGKEISWVAVNGIFIADRCILRDISWNNLCVQCLVFGKEITIGGFHYDLRLPLVGAKEGEPYVWDSALDCSFGIRLNDGSIVVERSVIVGVQTKQKEET